MHGLVLGKFMPPHLGHLYLLDFARHYTPDLTVVVGSLAREPIAGAVRHAWMQELAPWARVVHLQDENPQFPEEHPDFWAIWRESLKRCSARSIDLLFASEDYGQRLAEEIGAQFIPCNGARQLVPISATEIRSDPWKHWRFLPPCVRAHYCRRVCIFGPESTGKSTLAQELAQHFQGALVPEFARQWIEGLKRPLQLSDMDIIARAQNASEDSLARQSSGLLFCDTDSLTTTLWCRELFGQVPPSVEQLARERRYDLTLLTDVDVPWVADPVRYRPQERQRFWEACRERLDLHGRVWKEIRGDWDARRKLAHQAVEELLHRDKDLPTNIAKL